MLSLTSVWGSSVDDGCVIAVASGKGGTGKTTLATNLALYVSRQGKKVQYLDCDVEAPNGHLFLKPEIESKDEIAVEVPEVDTRV